MKSRDDRSELTDDTLLAGVAVGDDAAVDEFITRFERRVYGAAISLVGDPSLAQEIAQDTFVRVWRHAATYDPRRGAVHTWVLRITHNLCVDALRVRRPVAVDPLLLFDLADDRAGVSERIAHAATVRGALAELPAEQARAVVMAAMFGYSARSIAERDGVPLATAKTRIRLGMGKLRAHMARAEEGAA